MCKTIINYGKLVHVLAIAFLLLACNNREEGNLDLSKAILPSPPEALFIDDPAYRVWCGSMIKGEDGKYHLFYSRWPAETGHGSWISHSEIAHAVSDSPTGPYVFSDVSLPKRGPEWWDGMTSHNPTIHKFDGKYYLYYLGTTGDGRVTKEYLNPSHFYNKRIGVAVADSPYGPWKRSDHPLIDVSDDPGAADNLYTTNPSILRRNDGKYVMIYKCSSKWSPKGGKDNVVTHRVAISDSPDGPFEKLPGTPFAMDGVNFPAEDPYIFEYDGYYYAIVKDMTGAFTDAGKFALVLFSSPDAITWKLAKHPKVTSPHIEWTDGTVTELHRLERPQLYIEDGIPKVLFCAGMYKGKGQRSFNVAIPLDVRK